ncbi:MAG TPA: hypothetical protein VM598_03500, partial [Bdellovibrionota bacterium]|nr:hypothetical protein [Bdellovibrionota bacterium]
SWPVNETILADDGYSGLRLAAGVAMPHDRSRYVLIPVGQIPCTAGWNECAIKNDNYGQMAYVQEVASNGTVANIGQIRPSTGEYVVQAALDGDELALLTGSRPRALDSPFSGAFDFKSIELHRRDSAGRWQLVASAEIAPTCHAWCDGGFDFHMAMKNRILSMKDGRIVLIHERYSLPRPYYFQSSRNKAKLFRLSRDADGRERLSLEHSIDVPSDPLAQVGRDDYAFTVWQGDSTFAVYTYAGDVQRGWVHVYGKAETGAPRLLRSVPVGCRDRGGDAHSQLAAYAADLLFVVTPLGIQVLDTAVASVPQVSLITDYRKPIPGVQLPGMACASGVEVSEGKLAVLSLTDFELRTLDRHAQVALYSLQSASIRLEGAWHIAEIRAPLSYSFGIASGQLVFQEYSTFALLPRVVRSYRLARP